MQTIGEYEPEIGHVDEGVVEGGEDSGNTEDEFTCFLVILQLVPGSSRSVYLHPEFAHCMIGRPYLHGFEVRERCSPPCALLSFPLVAF